MTISFKVILEFKYIERVFTHVARIYANLLEQKKAFTWEKSSTPKGFSGYTNMAPVSFTVLEHQYGRCDVKWKRFIFWPRVAPGCVAHVSGAW